MQNKNKSDVLNLINIFSEQIKTEYKVAAIYLFGSYCYGTPSDNSDIDLAVVMSGSVTNDIDFDIFVKAQRISLDLEPVSFSKTDFENDASDLIVEIKTKGEKVA